MSNVIELQKDLSVKSITFITNSRQKITLFATDMSKIKINGEKPYYNPNKSEPIHEFRFQIDTSVFQLQIDTKKSYSNALMNHFDINQIMVTTKYLVIQYDNDQRKEYNVNELFKSASLSNDTNILYVAMTSM